ncbi:MAG: Hydrogenase isoenzymes formation protein HypE [Deltaproteobacteria bacterium ADurb.Bin510]|nr:MAG: Hydrogenase isoenzymes formation protein HypE [Deltaproteobacteria bacterium ADurb.Bin510]
MPTSKASPNILPVGKLPVELLRGFLGAAATANPDVIVGPGIGADAAAIRFGSETLIIKTDPITFATSEIASYLVAVNSNDIACMGGVPEYLLATVLLPEGRTTAESATLLLESIETAAQAAGITLVGGHTEITHGLERPIVCGCMLGRLRHDHVIQTRDARPGDKLLLSKNLPLEAISIIAHERPERLDLNPDDLQRARNLIKNPGISVVREARLALSCGGVSAMHDPTEGGLATGLHELAEAADCGLRIDYASLPFDPLARQVLEPFAIDPLGAIASGSLLLACAPDKADAILAAWRQAGVQGSLIGALTADKQRRLVRDGQTIELPSFSADEITKVFKA